MNRREKTGPDKFKSSRNDFSNSIILETPVHWIKMSFYVEEEQRNNNFYYFTVNIQIKYFK